MLCEKRSDGTIDCIASHHLPHEYDSKVLEFEYAKYGMIGLETAYAVLNTCLKGIQQQENWWNSYLLNPRKIFGLEAVTVKEGKKASLTLFAPDAKWKVQEQISQIKIKKFSFHWKRTERKSNWDN